MSNSSQTRQRRHLPAFNQFWENLEETPISQIENSLWLRVFVQALVAVGIIATDVAAETQMSLWAVPLSIVGATWSWNQRQSRNIPVKFLLAIGMLLATADFFRNLIGNLNDTRLVLAQLLIQLQVLHSFDLPRRKDLGYSMVIGLILLGVAGTVSETLTFAPLLIAFLAIALPVLVLDYRSRLGLVNDTKSKSPLKIPALAANLSWRRLSIFFLIILALGLSIFALMPRVPGYKLRTLPVSAPIQVEGKLNGSEIVNPGYIRGRRGRGQAGGKGVGTGSGYEQDKTEGKGELDSTFYYGFGNKINQNLRGELKQQVVMRVRSQSPGFWRVLAFDKYTGQGWEISRNKQVQKIQRPSWSYQFMIPLSGIFNRSQEVIQSYTVVSELPNLIPALSNPTELYFPTPEISIDKENGLRSPVPLTEGTTYSVISQVPYRDRTALGKASTKYSERITNYYLQVPPKIAGKVRKHTEEILARSPKPLTSAYEKALYLTQYVKQRYTLPKDPFGLPFLEDNEDLVEAFLFKYKEGYPDHFSTALTVMLRSIGIPSRLVVGFGEGQFNPFTGFHVVSNTDAFAMTEVYFPRFGWFTFDPIPGHPLIPPSVEEDQTFSVLQQFWKWVAGWLPSPVSSFISRAFEFIARGIVGAIAWFFALFSKGWVGLFTALITSIALGFLGWLGWEQFKTWRYRRWLNKLPAMESIYQQMLNTLANQGFRKHPAQTPLEYAQVSRSHHPSVTADAIHDISNAYVSWRYGGEQQNTDWLQQRLRELIKSIQPSVVNNQLLRRWKDRKSDRTLA
ncbi:MAG TPA: DUF3488 and DUF4129 domain-containing transglutaminase family protein [Candidatus Sericytochromatia bacterium]